MTAIDQDLVFKRMEYATEQHAKIMVENADLRAELADARAELDETQIALGTMTADFYGIRDGSLVREYRAANERLSGDLVVANALSCGLKAELSEMTAELAEAKAEIERLRKLLVPFAKLADSIDAANAEGPGYIMGSDYIGPAKSLDNWGATFGDSRRARDALRNAPPTA
jgi:hypothetical protein